MPIIHHNLEKNILEITINRVKSDNIRLILDYTFMNKLYVKTALDDVYGMFKNGLSQHDIDNLITVNVIGYKKRKTELDIRYHLALHQKFPVEKLFQNTHFYVDSSKVSTCFDIAIDACVKQFDDLRQELGQEFLDELEQLIYTI